MLEISSSLPASGRFSVFNHASDTTILVHSSPLPSGLGLLMYDALPIGPFLRRYCIWTDLWQIDNAYPVGTTIIPCKV